MYRPAFERTERLERGRCLLRAQVTSGPGQTLLQSSFSLETLQWLILFHQFLNPSQLPEGQTLIFVFHRRLTTQRIKTGLQHQRGGPATVCNDLQTCQAMGR